MKFSSQRIPVFFFNPVLERFTKDIALCSNWPSDECALINAKDIILIHRNCAIIGKPLGRLVFPGEAELFHVHSSCCLKVTRKKSLNMKLNCYFVYFNAIC